MRKGERRKMGLEGSGRLKKCVEGGVR